MHDTLTETELTQIQDILIEQLGIQREQITPEAALEADLGADSLEKVEIVMSLEETFKMTIPDDQADGVETVGDLYEAVGALLEKEKR